MIALLLAVGAWAADAPRWELEARYAIGAYSLSQVATDPTGPLTPGAVTADRLTAAGPALRARAWLAGPLGAEVAVATAAVDGAPAAATGAADTPAPLLGGEATARLRRPLALGAVTLEPGAAVGLRAGRVTAHGLDPRGGDPMSVSLWTVGPTASAELTATVGGRLLARGAARVDLPTGPTGTGAELGLGVRLWSGLHLTATASTAIQDVVFYAPSGDDWAEAGHLSDRRSGVGLGVLWRR